MSDQPAAQPDQELLDIAAKLAGVQTVDLLHVVRRADGSLVVIIATGQKYVFQPEQIVAQLGSELDTYSRTQLAATAAAATGTRSGSAAPKPKKAA